jgi:PAS domain S-box-containing protein
MARRLTLTLLASMLALTIALAAVSGAQSFARARRDYQGMGCENALLGARIVQYVMEKAEGNGLFDHETLFHARYKPIDGQGPAQYHTDYDFYFDRNVTTILDAFLQADNIYYAYVISDDGYIPSHTEEAVAKTRRPPEACLAARHSPGQNGVHQSPVERQFYEFHAPITVDGQHWGEFRVGIPTALVTNGTIDSVRSTLAVTCALALVVVGLTLVLVRRSLRPLRILTDATRRMAAGDRSARCAYCERDELGVLAGAFNGMAEKIAQAHDHLELQVRERTEDLETANRSLQTEITERKRVEDDRCESEARLKIIVDSLQAGVVLIDRATHMVVDANPAALSMFRAPRDTVIGHICHKFICPAGRGRCPVTDLGEAVDDSERMLLTADGQRTPVLKTVVPVTLRGHDYLLESFVDISDRKRVEGELAAHRERLEELVRERTQKLMEAERQVLQGEKLASVGRLAAGVAHEINTPIQYVGDNLRALADSYEDIRAVIGEYRALVQLVAAAGTSPEVAARAQAAEQEHDLEFILEDAPKAVSQGLEGVQRVANIVRAMRDFSHVKGGEISSVDLNHCLQSTLTVARNEYKYVADVETDFAELPNVECYAGELNQVFLNILVNAAHAIQDTGKRGQITVTTRVAGEQVEIAIADTGVGIPEEIRNKIYEPFFTTKEVGRGTGQGLSIAHQIVVGVHGGQLTCESVVGAGTTFRIRLPLRLAAQVPPGEAS